ncbi:hypothetical protein EJ05DRAFT_503488 [Pseudovirgaria hyperparasitica]|uniref:Uncharacterized protein n=1 Tax=Pseudovirgaria hyperparasitica TaxID=470096 RepID=A0A6A6VY53_9PEZI|nr:uncharacterized protein EJ05DRAFT_503488 [Pseudovirgaria hyperparasitica]KAF2755183.1 hypothetical protein EJ05DRAFT_503488 [Pseudovirgaria hyperparasitica]
MSTAVAAPPSTAAHTSSSSTTETSRSYSTIAPLHPATTPSKPSQTSAHNSPHSSDGASQRGMEPRRSPNSLRAPPAKISVKKEPTSPEIPTGRHRPRRLELANNGPIGQTTLTARGPMTAKESAGLAIQDVGLACLSPGFHTQDPSMREQLQRSIDVRENQRKIIEARQKNAGKTPADPAEGSRQDYNSFRSAAKTPGTSRRKGPPPGLSINAPSHQQFANERVIQSAPLHQTFTGLRPQPGQPMPRQVANAPSSLSHTSHIHHVPATQTSNRLPPISDVFAAEGIGRHSNHSPGHSSNSNNQPPLPSPGFPPSQQQSQQPPPTSRPREYKSAEEAVASLSGGREDLMPKIVHYGGHQPPTPPSPMPQHGSANYHPGAVPSSELHRTSSARRRGRDEYERDAGSPPLGRQAEPRRSGPFGEGRDSPETQRKKKEEFIQLCARAWDLMHS